MKRASGVIGLIALSLFALVGGTLLFWPSLWSDATGLVVAEQQRIHRALSVSVVELKQEGSFSAVLGLSLLSFAYGIFHALGPGHGKAIISSYLVATGDTIRRGVVLALVSALMQGLTAIVLVSVLVVALGMTARAATANVAWLELASYGLMAAAGAFLLYRKTVEPWLPASHLAVYHRDRAHDGCGHVHLPPTELAARPLSLTSLAGVVTAIGVRPCMGAVLVLVFALSHGLITAGITAVLAMSIGTGLTVSGLAILTVLARGDGLRKLIVHDGWFAAIHHTLGIAGSLVLLALGVLFFAGALNAPTANPLGIPG